MATSLPEALRKEPKTRPDDAWIDEDFKKEHPDQLISAIGFTVEDNEDENFYAKRRLRFKK